MSDIAIYTRKSKFTGKGESIENQIIKCKKFIEFKFEDNPEEAQIFIDEGFTGRNENRPRFQALMQKVKAGEIKHIVLYQLNRFGRNARDIMNSLQACTDNNCIIYSASEGFDSSTSFGRAVMGILASLAQLESEQISERITDNMYTLARKGRWLGGQSPLGFDGVKELYLDENGKERSITKLKVNTEELKIVRAIYKKYLEEKSLSKVSKWSLINNLRGKNGGNIDKSAINTILQNPVYVKSNKSIFDFLESEGYEVCGNPNGNGLLRYAQDKESRIIAVSNHKGIISADDWLEVQTILKENTAKAPRLGKTKTALLTGILKCECGSGMQVRYGPPKKDGTRNFYYTCSMKVNSGGTRCSSKNINGDLLEDQFIKYLKNYNSTMLIDSLEKALDDSRNLEKAIDNNYINKEIEKSEKAIKVLLNKIKLVDDIDVSKILLSEIQNEKEKIKKYENDKKELIEDQSKLLLSQSELLNIINSLNDFNDTFDLLNFEDRKSAIDNLIGTINIKDGVFHIAFKVKKN